MRRHIVFEEVAVRGMRRWVDKDGKRHQQTKKFSQTINPFNLLPSLRRRRAHQAQVRGLRRGARLHPLREVHGDGPDIRSAGGGSGWRLLRSALSEAVVRRAPRCIDREEWSEERNESLPLRRHSRISDAREG